MPARKLFAWLGLAGLFIITATILWQAARQIRPVDRNAIHTAGAATNAVWQTENPPTKEWILPACPCPFRPANATALPASITATQPRITETPVVVTSKPEVTPSLPMLGILAIGILAEAAFLWVGWQLIQRRWYFLGYLAGLIPIFTVWYLAERDALMQCITCHRLFEYDIAHNLCCTLESVPIVPYAQMAAAVNLLYAILVSAALLRHRRKFPSLENGPANFLVSKAVHPVVYPFLVHACLFVSSFMTVAALSTRITHFSFGEWHSAEGAFYVGFIPIIPVFLISWAFLSDFAAQVAILRREGMRQGQGALATLIFSILAWLILSFVCWNITFGVMIFGYFG